MENTFRNMVIITGAVIIVSITGCVSKGFVLEEINKSKAETSAQIKQEVKQSSDVMFQALLGSFRAERKRLQETIDALDKEIKELETITGTPPETPKGKPDEAPQPSKK